MCPKVWVQRNEWHRQTVCVICALNVLERPARAIADFWSLIFVQSMSQNPEDVLFVIKQDAGKMYISSCERLEAENILQRELQKWQKAVLPLVISFDFNRSINSFSCKRFDGRTDGHLESGGQNQEPKIREPLWNHCPFNTHPKRCGSGFIPHILYRLRLCVLGVLLRWNLLHIVDFAAEWYLKRQLPVIEISELFCLLGILFVSFWPG